MMDIAAFIDSPDRDEDLAVDLAIALADYCIEAKHTLWLACDALCALEIGLGLLGQNEAPTVEGGDRQRSSIHLLPLIKRRDMPDDASLRESDDKSGGGLREIIELGVFTSIPDDGREGHGTDGIDRRFGNDAGTSLRQLIIREKPNYVIGLGADSELWESISSGMRQADSSRTMVLSVGDFGRSDVAGATIRNEIRAVVDDGERLPEEAGERLSEELDDAFRLTEKRARENGEFVANFLQFFARSE